MLGLCEPYYFCVFFIPPPPLGSPRTKKMKRYVLYVLCYPHEMITPTFIFSAFLSHLHEKMCVVSVHYHFHEMITPHSFLLFLFLSHPHEKRYVLFVHCDREAPLCLSGIASIVCIHVLLLMVEHPIFFFFPRPRPSPVNETQTKTL